MSMMKGPGQNHESGGGNDSPPEKLDLVAPKFGGRPFPNWPKKLIVAIDGWAQTGKNTAGELVAEAIGGVMVDSGRFYRAFTKACIDKGVNLDAEDCVAEFCWNASLDFRLLHEGGKVMEMQVAIDGKWFTKEELFLVGRDTSRVARVFEVRQIVNRALRMCEKFGRVVMLGRDIGSTVIPDTQFKFFLDAPRQIREQRHLRTTKSLGALERDFADRHCVVIANDALKVDTGSLQPNDVRGIILIEMMWRLGEFAGKKKPI